MKKHLISIVVIALFVVYSQSCSSSRNEDQPNSSSERSSGKITLTGSSTLAPLASEIGKRFESLNPDVRIDVQTGGSSRGIADVREGIADIGMVSRSLTGDENDLMSFPVAKDGICIILHKSNPVGKLSDKEIIDIYKGNIRNWKKVGGKDALITVINKAEGRATLGLFLEYFMLKNSEINAHIVIGDNEQGVKTVAGNENAVGYVSIGTAEYDSEIGIPIKLLPVGGVAATLKNLENESFPLSRPLNFVTEQEPEGLIKKFMDFARSEAVHDIVREQYFVPVSK